jgi:hypothetical protein
VGNESAAWLSPSNFLERVPFSKHSIFFQAAS